MSKMDIYEIVLSRASNEHKERLENEFEVIKQYGLEAEILALYDVVTILKERGINYVFSGDTQNILALYLLGITNADPVKHRVSFDIISYILKKKGGLSSVFISDKEGVKILNEKFYESSNPVKGQKSLILKQ